jgi:hypothetical protein
MTNDRDRPADLAAVAADDALLDALGRGDAAPDDDELAGLLAAWRSDLDADLPQLDLPTLDDLPEETTQVLPPRRRRTGRLTKLLTGVAAALLLLAGIAVGVGQAGPDSPLWPLTRVMYPQQADVRAAQHAIAQARAAAQAGRVDEARRHLDEATALVDRIRDQSAASRLRDEIEQVRRMLEGSAVVPGTTSTPGTEPSTAPSVSPSPPPGGPGGGQTGNPGGGGATTTTPGGGGILPPIVPTLPPIVPTLPPILPSGGLLPSILPSIPLPI